MPARSGPVRYGEMLQQLNMTGTGVLNTNSLIDNSSRARAGLRLAAVLLGGTILAGLPQTALAQTAPAPAPVAAPAAPAADTIQSITVVGAQRLEPDTIR